MHQELAEDIHTPVIGDEGEDLAHVEARREPRKEITGPLDAFRDVPDSEEFVQEVFE